MTPPDSEGLLSKIRAGFADAGIRILDMALRSFPGESIVVVEVAEADFQAAMAAASDLDSLVSDGFIIVKKKLSEASKPAMARAYSLLDPRINSLIELLNERSRTSEQQPSLRYVPDAAHNLNVAASRRHHLIFGRRGVGKTALMLEAKRFVELKGASTFWINIQTMRALSAHDAFLTTASRFCDIPEVIHLGRAKPPKSVRLAAEIKEDISRAIASPKKRQLTATLLPQLQQLFNVIGKETGDHIYIFIDDFHYLSMKEQPFFLDMIHSVTRDNPTWIKASAIKHQARRFTDNPPTGLQTGHDAALINLDITLEQPAKAKTFLTSILRTYTEEAKLTRSTDALSPQAIDRLVLASGGVPRDFLVLAAASIQVARERPNARAAGVQDVNEAAGKNAQTKLQELEDDAASSSGKSKSKIDSLSRLREVLLEAEQVTYFRVDFQDKETHPLEYELLQSLMDLRIVHLINAGLSDERRAGRRSEVYMLDLSQFSGTRFKRNLKVLDYSKGHLVLKKTGAPGVPRVGDSPTKLQGILRRGPQFSLDQFTGFVAGS